MNFRSFASLLGVLALTGLVPAKANLILTPVTVAAGSAACVAQTSGLTGTLTLFTAGGANLDFGNPANYGTTEAGCDFRLVGTPAAITAGNAPIVGTLFTFTGSICELQGANDGCNGFPNPPKSPDTVQLEFITANQITISDVAAGGSFSFTLNAPSSAVPEPASMLFVGSALLLGAFGLKRIRHNRAS